MLIKQHNYESLQTQYIFSILFCPLGLNYLRLLIANLRLPNEQILEI